MFPTEDVVAAMHAFLTAKNVVKDLIGGFLSLNFPPDGVGIAARRLPGLDLCMGGLTQRISENWGSLLRFVRGL